MRMALSLAGRLLVAAHNLLDENFYRSVVFILEHNEEGAVGVILNRPSKTGVDDPLPHWQSLAAPPAVVFVGGPVQPGAAICLGHGRPEDHAEGWRPLFGRLGTVDLGSDPDEVSRHVEAIRVFSGYAGWGKGQLEMEISAGGWFVVDAQPGDALSERATELWRIVLRRQGGKLAVLANFPDDPSLN